MQALLIGQCDEFSLTSSSHYSRVNISPIVNLNPQVTMGHCLSDWLGTLLDLIGSMMVEEALMGVESGAFYESYLFFVHSYKGLTLRGLGGITKTWTRPCLCYGQ